MKTRREFKNFLAIVCLATTLSLLWLNNTFAQTPDAKEIVQKADEKYQGEKSSYSEMEMTIVRKTWTRTVSFKSWTKGTDNSLTLITAPAKEMNQTFLKRGNEMWNWNPSIGRMIKLPPSMLSQGWMGSDYTNDDILKQSSIVIDYTHKIVGYVTLEGKDFDKIGRIPKPEAAFVWGKQIKWISKKEYLILKTEFYDEDMYLVKTETGSKIKKMDDREIPTFIEIVPEDNTGNKTIVEIKTIKFNIDVSDGYFSQQNMKKIR